MIFRPKKKQKKRGSSENPKEKKKGIPRIERGTSSLLVKRCATQLYSRIFLIHFYISRRRPTRCLFFLFFFSFSFSLSPLPLPLPLPSMPPQQKKLLLARRFLLFASVEIMCRPIGRGKWERNLPSSAVAYMPWANFTRAPGIPHCDQGSEGLTSG